MAGDWIKVEHATLDKPEVSLFSELLGVPVDQGVGILIRFWVWVDRNARNGCVTHVTPSVTDTVMHVPGFSAALEMIGWGKFDKALRTLTIPNHDRHNETSAKTRTTNAERQARWRNAHRNVTSVTKALPEKRREEKNITTTSLVAPNGSTGESRLGTRLRPDWSLPDDWKQWAIDAYQLDPQRVVRISLSFRDYWLAKPGKEGRKADWQATWRNWIRKETERAA